MTTTTPTDIQTMTAELQQIRPPTWITHTLTIALPLVGVLVALLLRVLWPAPPVPVEVVIIAAQAALIIMGMLGAAIVHLGHLVATNGFSRAGLLQTVDEESMWVRAHYDEMRQIVEEGGKALEQLPGVPAAVAESQQRIHELEQRVREGVAAIPPEQLDALKRFLSGLAAPPSAVPVLAIGESAGDPNRPIA